MCQPAAPPLLRRHLQLPKQHVLASFKRGQHGGKRTACAQLCLGFLCCQSHLNRLAPASPQVRYENRQTCAHQRTRIKGRFAKADPAASEAAFWFWGMPGTNGAGHEPFFPVFSHPVSPIPPLKCCTPNPHQPLLAGNVLCRATGAAAEAGAAADADRDAAGAGSDHEIEMLEAAVAAAAAAQQQQQQGQPHTGQPLRPPPPPQAQQQHGAAAAVGLDLPGAVLPVLSAPVNAFDSFAAAVAAATAAARARPGDAGRKRRRAGSPSAERSHSSGSNPSPRFATRKPPGDGGLAEFAATPAGAVLPVLPAEPTVPQQQQQQQPAPEPQAPTPMDATEPQQPPSKGAPAALGDAAIDAGSAAPAAWPCPPSTARGDAATATEAAGAAGRTAAAAASSPGGEPLVTGAALAGAPPACSNASETLAQRGDGAWPWAAQGPAGGGNGAA